MPSYPLAVAARLCRVHRNTLYRAVRAGRLPRDAAGLVATEDLVRLGFLSAHRAQERPPPRSPPEPVPLDRLEACLRQAERLLTRLETLTADLRQLVQQHHVTRPR